MWKCPKCGRAFASTGQHHFCGKAPKTVDDYILSQDESVREQLQRVRAVLPYLEAIKPNQLEAAALTGESSPEKAARALREAGAKRVFISMGAEGVCFSGPDGEGTVPARPVPILPLTGAGDALCAGIARALISGKSTREAALAGCQAAWETLMAGQ